MNYKDQLQDKRWKLRRLEILKRDKFTCQLCDYFGEKVNVHHLKYTGMAWESPDGDLITLCSGCHRTTHKPEINDKRFEVMRIIHTVDITLSRDGEKIH